MNDKVSKLNSEAHKITVENNIIPRKTNIWGSGLGIFLVKKIPIKKCLILTFLVFRHFQSDRFQEIGIPLTIWNATYTPVHLGYEVA